MERNGHRLSAGMLMLLLGATLLFAEPPAGSKEQWGQYRGPNRDGVAAGDARLSAWPANGPKQVWKQPVGVGFSGIVIAGDRLLTMFGEDSTEFLACFDRKSGKERWRQPVGKLFVDDLGNGPRATPVVDGKLVFALSSYGQMHALEIANGRPLWMYSLADSFEIKVPQRGFSTSPLVVDDLLLVQAGGGDGEALVALDKKSGQKAWTAVDGLPSYSSPIDATIHGQRQLVFATVRVVERKPIFETVGVTPQGEVLWRGPSIPGIIAMPVLVAPDKIFVSGSNDDGCSLIKVSRDGNAFTAAELWQNREMKNHFNSSVYFDGNIYGFSKATLKCIDAATGEQRWVKRGFGKGSLIVAGGHLLVVSDRGELALLQATPEAYRELGRAHLIDGKSWTSPTYFDGHIYVRSVQEMASYKLVP